ncbi:hypothetical protein tinsulaeT_37140 [Thalassotalea insulae]|uniref:Type IV / VI secretion system DotU domain-containing protein n=1 Tax=Thalassotalea insulae TaxID=2056778 RepID=A0ABQ6GYG7_9GAMM|nr:DotU family type IV/VI secretion system protein [Thalassotalea insulae]GLX80374.1 hypothetical protein tinsulaeT_37140 [Thalassotalea insulae]
MSVAAFNLVNLMNEFYQKIATIKKWIAQDRLALEAKIILRLQEAPNDNEIATAINLILSQWIAQKRLYWKDNRLTDRQLELLDKACFAMCALADELFLLQIDWPGSEQWNEALLEDHFFQSCSAGGTFYRDVDDLLADGTYDEMEMQLAAVYLMTLRLGFAGKFHDNQEELTKYRRKLFNIVAQNQPSAREIIHQEAYEHCLVSLQEQRLAPISNWHRGAVYGLALYIIIGIIAWLALNHGVDKWISI